MTGILWIEQINDKSYTNFDPTDKQPFDGIEAFESRGISEIFH